MPNNVLSIFKILENLWPNAQCELEHYNEFQLLIAVVLSAQATDKSVNKALLPILAENKNFSAQHLIDMGEQNFLQAIRSIGLAPTKAKNCYKIATILQEKFQGKVPSNREELEALPGVGRKTANVVLNVLFKIPTIAVDTHVERVAKRLGLVPLSASPVKVEEELLKIVPKKYRLQAHHLFIFHGRYHCVARNPKCATCPLEQLCEKNI
ncbi:MAG: endonuclease III [Bdellovibrionota bacterium]